MRVLIVDDDKVQVVMISECLEIFEADHVSNGDDALVLFKRAHEMGEPYNLIIMDLMMPGFDGYMVVEALRRLERQENLSPSKIIVITGTSSKEGLTDRLRSQCDDYLEKPVSSDRLLKSLEQMELI